MRKKHFCKGFGVKGVQSSPAIGGGEFRYCLLYKAARKCVTVDSGNNGKGKRRQIDGSEFGAASVYSIAIAASLPNYWRTHSRSLSGQISLSLFDRGLTTKIRTFTPAGQVRPRETPHTGNQWQIGCDQSLMIVSSHT